jgi:uncharacterized iron-regulated membrane protein
MSSKTSARLPAKAGNSRFVARMIESHSILGLAFAALIYVVSLTGAFTVFAHEIEIWENTDIAIPADRITPKVYERALADALARRDPSGKIINLIAHGPTPFAPVLVVGLNERDSGGDFRQTSWLADPATGQLLGKVDAPLADLIEQLHVALHLPAPWGGYLVGWLGVCMFSLILSGILAHPSIVRDAFKLRLDRNRRIAWTDMHNRLSVWGLPFHIILTFTGGFLGLAGIIVGAVAMIAYEGDQERAVATLQGPQAIEGRALAGLPPVARMVARVQQGEKPIELIIVNNVENDGGTTQITVHDDAILDNFTAQIFRNNGAFLQNFGGAEAPGGIRAAFMLQPLHFGTFGGYPVKFLYFFMALALTWVTSSGMKIWFARRAQQGRPVPGMEAAWQGMTAGLTLGLAAATLGSAAGAGEAVLAICLSLWTITLLAFVARRWPSALLYRGVTALAAILLLAAVGLSVANASVSGIALSVALCIGAMAAGLLVFTLRAQKSEAMDLGLELRRHVHEPPIY